MEALGYMGMPVHDGLQCGKKVHGDDHHKARTGPGSWQGWSETTTLQNYMATIMPGHTPDAVHYWPNG